MPWPFLKAKQKVDVDREQAERSVARDSCVCIPASLYARLYVCTMYVGYGMTCLDVCMSVYIWVCKGTRVCCVAYNAGVLVIASAMIRLVTYVRVIAERHGAGNDQALAPQTQRGGL